jgi:hypothetical protein
VVAAEADVPVLASPDGRRYEAYALTSSADRWIP